MTSKTKIKKNKKGVIFSILLIVFFLLLLNYSKIIVNEFSFYSDQSSNFVDLNSQVDIERNIGQVTLDILDINLENITYNGNTTLFFSEFGKTQVNYNSKLSAYESFIESNYSNIVNKNISLTNYVHEFTIYPYLSRAFLDNNQLQIVTTNYTNISSISFTVLLDETFDTYVWPLDNSSAQPLIFVTFIDKNSTSVNRSAHLHPESLTNNEFRLTNSTNGYYASLIFGKVVENGTLILRTPDIAASIVNLSISYKGNSSIRMFSSADLTLGTKSGKLELI